MHLKMEQMEVESGRWQLKASRRSFPSALTPKPHWCHCCNCFDTLKLALILFGQWVKLYVRREGGHISWVHHCICAYWPEQHLFVLLVTAFKWEARTYYSTSLHRPVKKRQIWFPAVKILFKCYAIQIPASARKKEKRFKKRDVFKLWCLLCSLI